MSTDEILDEDGYNVVPEDEPVNNFLFLFFFIKFLDRKKMRFLENNCLNIKKKYFLFKF